MTARTCQTCKHYEPSPTWQCGWCRNPRLYPPQHSPLVHQDALACSRGLGDSWEPADGEEDPRRQRALAGERRPLTIFASTPQLALPGGGVFAASNIGGGGGGLQGSSRPERPVTPPGQDRTISFQPEERYWSDYLRIALPVAGLIILLFLLYYWAGRIIGGGDDPTPTPAATVVTSTPLPFVASPPASPEVPTVPVTPTSTPTPVPTEEVETPPAGEFPTYDIGDTVLTIDAVNLRAEPSTTAEIVEELAAGTPLTIREPFIDDGDLDWWPVTDPATGLEGYVREDTVEPQSEE